MKKTFLIFSILLCLLPAISLASPISDLKNSIYGQVRQNAIDSFSALFNRKVTIERAEGRLIGQIDFINFTIPGIGTIKKMTLNYNPIIMLETKGDIVPALYEIVVEDGKFDIIRNNQGKINLLSALSSGDPSSKTPPPPFKGIITLRNCTGLYSDQQGFKAGSPTFHTNISELNGSVNLKNLNNIRFNLSAKIPEQINISGSIKPSSANYSANINIQDVSLKKWGNYITPQAEI
ncbi:MAG: hypothetical protein WCV91_07100, partial [Candidatus Margulisiibacteriota bacterium]